MWAEEILQIFPDAMRPKWRMVAERADELQEIRLRAGKPITVLLRNREWFLTAAGELTRNVDKAARSKEQELETVINHVCQYSLYAYADEIKRGFLTIPGGHRIGLAGQVILEQGDHIRNIKYIRYLNIRVSHEIRGAADSVIPFLYQDRQILNTLIISPPGGGKTTMLRDIIRQLSDGTIYGAGVNVSVVDERSEIAGSYMGIAQNDVGIRTDVLDACPKCEGMMMLIRSMAPSVLAVDELGSRDDVEALKAASGCGCKIVATIHGNSVAEVGCKGYMEEIMKDKLFERYLVLTRRAGACAIEGIYDKEGRSCLSC